MSLERVQVDLWKIPKQIVESLVVPTESKYLISFIDQFSKYIKLYKIANKKAVTTAQQLEKYITTCKKPRKSFKQIMEQSLRVNLKTW
ncbi:unnamed protein product [Blepharisma stoltei]|uniref:Integrase catalytic domain-containing protein n=1 Tax=Blepharisma stoltei TaxID=1481888 RepID=A0AAU9J7T0_9CILI|nr:unnamed protein product [Blepharisma stoltei]